MSLRGPPCFKKHQQVDIDTLSFTHHLSHTTLSHPLFHTQLSHTTFHTHNFVTHHLWHMIFHTPLCHTQSLTRHLTHNFVTHRLSHTICHTPSLTHHLWHTIFHTTSPHTVFHTPSQTIFHTQLCHTPSLAHTIFGTWSFTHHFVTHHLSHAIFDTPSYTYHLSPHHLSHTTLSQTIFPPPPPLSFLPSPSPLQILLIIIGRSWLVGLCGPLTFFSIKTIRCSTRITDTQLSSMLQLEYFTRPFDVLHRSWTMLMLDKKTIAVCPFAVTLIAEPQAF